LALLFVCEGKLMVTLEREYVGPSKAGRRAGLSPQRIRQLVKAGVIPATVTDLGMLIAVEDLDRYLKTRRPTQVGAAR
jgi:hypothetical protein